MNEDESAVKKWKVIRLEAKFEKHANGVEVSRGGRGDTAVLPEQLCSKHWGT